MSMLRPAHTAWVHHGSINHGPRRIRVRGVTTSAGMEKAVRDAIRVCYVGREGGVMRRRRSEVREGRLWQEANGYGNGDGYGRDG